MKKIILYATLAMISMISFAANPINENHRDVIHQYVQKNIMPVLAEKRQAFNDLLTIAEQNELASYREQLNFLFESHRAARQEKNKSSEPEVADAVPQSRHDNHRKVWEIMTKVQVIADNHEEELNTIFSGLEPLQQQWKDDISKIVADNENQAGESSASYSNHNDRWPFYRAWSRKGFLLLNPSQTVAERKESTTDLSTLALSIFPNPADDEFTLNLAGLSSNNKLTISDVTGKVVREKENAQPTESVSCNDLANGIYFVQLNSDNQIINKKLIVNHN